MNQKKIPVIDDDPVQVATKLREEVERRMEQGDFPVRYDAPIRVVSDVEDEVRRWTDQKKILVIDDDPVQVAAVADVLKNRPYHVIAAFDGAEVPQIVAEERPALIIMDVVTPVKHLLKAIQELSTEDKCYFCSHTLLLTPYRCQPFDQQELLRQVEDILTKILVIDDDPVQVAAVADVLKSRSYHVVVVYDGNEIPQKIVEEEPDLIIMDVVTPVKHLLKAVRELSTEDKCYFYSHTLLLTPYRCQPFDHQELLKQVELLLNR